MACSRVNFTVTFTFYRYGSTLSLTWALDGVGGQRHAPAALPLAKRRRDHCAGGSMGPSAGLVTCNECRMQPQIAQIVH